MLQHESTNEPSKRLDANQVFSKPNGIDSEIIIILKNTVII